MVGKMNYLSFFLAIFDKAITDYRQATKNKKIKWYDGKFVNSAVVINDIESFFSKDNEVYSLCIEFFPDLERIKIKKGGQRCCKKKKREV